MQNKTLYIGIDAGDRTFSMDAADEATGQLSPVMLPGQRNNTPILSAVGCKKDGTFELLQSGQPYDPEMYSEILVNFKRQPSAVSAEELDQYKRGLHQMLKLTLADEATAHTISDLARNCSEIVFCVGYPTNWSMEDVKLFQKMIDSSILGDRVQMEKRLGKAVRVMVERESTAAFIYAREHQKELGISRKDYVTVVDFGSSTINVTSLVIGARNTQYNSGHNFFGGRLVDCLLADYYLRMIPEEELHQIEELDRLNDRTASSLILMAASEAKETLNRSGVARIYTDFARPVKIDKETFVQLLDQPLARAVERFGLLSDTELKTFGDRSWHTILTQYLHAEKSNLENEDISTDLFIAVGGGALLEEVRAICGQVLPGVRFLEAADTTRTISRGLALAARRADRSAAFHQDVEDFLNNKMTKLIQAEVHTLANNVSGDIADYMCDRVIIPNMKRWKRNEAGYTTLNVTSRRIASYCSSTEFSRSLQSDAKIQRTIKEWSENRLGHAIAGELKMLCDKYGVKGFDIDKLNVMKIPSVTIDTSAPVAQVLEVLMNLVGMIAGVIAASISTSALIIVLEIVALFLPGLAAAIAEIIALIPGGLVILAGIAGVAVFRVFTQGWESVRSEIMDNIADFNIPGIARLAVMDSVIENSINKNRTQISAEIRKSLEGAENAGNIAKQINSEVHAQVTNKLDEILYAYESK